LFIIIILLLLLEVVVVVVVVVVVIVAAAAAAVAVVITSFMHVFTIIYIKNVCLEYVMLQLFCGHNVWYKYCYFPR